MTKGNQVDDLSRQIWKELKRKVNLAYYLGGPRFHHLNDLIGEPDPEKTAKPKVDKASAAKAAIKKKVADKAAVEGE